MTLLRLKRNAEVFKGREKKRKRKEIEREKTGNTSEITSFKLMIAKVHKRTEPDTGSCQKNHGLPIH